jgi:hypothetical protein
VFTGLGPAVSKTALKKMSAEVRSWRLHHYTTFSERDLARWINPSCRGMDELLRAVLPLGVASAAPAHQRLPDALAEKEI